MAGQRYGFVTFMDPQIAADVHAVRRARLTPLAHEHCSLHWQLGESRPGRVPITMCMPPAAQHIVESVAPICSAELPAVTTAPPHCHISVDLLAAFPALPLPFACAPATGFATDRLSLKVLSTESVIGSESVFMRHVSIPFDVRSVTGCRHLALLMCHSAPDVQECYRQPVDIGGRVLRVHRARGEMPKWQQGPTHAAPQGGLGAGRSLTMPFEEHPKVFDSENGLVVLWA